MRQCWCRLLYYQINLYFAYSDLQCGGTRGIILNVQLASLIVQPCATMCKIVQHCASLTEQQCATLCIIVQANRVEMCKGRATSESNCMSFLSGPPPPPCSIAKLDTFYWPLRSYDALPKDPTITLVRISGAKGFVLFWYVLWHFSPTILILISCQCLNGPKPYFMISGGGRNQSPGSPPPRKEFILVSFYPLNIHLTSYTLQREKKKSPKI